MLAADLFSIRFSQHFLRQTAHPKTVFFNPVMTTGFTGAESLETIRPLQGDEELLQKGSDLIVDLSRKTLESRCQYLWWHQIVQNLFTSRGHLKVDHPTILQVDGLFNEPILDQDTEGL